eukprot:4571318-Pyramimonas_sp.AAC.1
MAACLQSGNVERLLSARAGQSSTAGGAARRNRDGHWRDLWGARRPPAAVPLSAEGFRRPLFRPEQTREGPLFLRREVELRRYGPLLRGRLPGHHAQRFQPLEIRDLVAGKEAAPQ